MKKQKKCLACDSGWEHHCEVCGRLTEKGEKDMKGYKMVIQKIGRKKK